MNKPGQIRTVLAFAIVATALGGPTAWAADTVADLVFGRNLFAGLERPVIIDYALEQRLGNDQDVHGSVQMDVRSIDGAGKKEVYFDLFDGQTHHAFGPVEMTDQNPLVMVFLQRDVATMEKLTGGSQNYFRNRIREAFNQPAKVEPVQVDYSGNPVAATRITIRPFEQDPKIDRFPAYKDKMYEFVVADAVPGGIYKLGTQTADPSTGSHLLDETMIITMPGDRK